MRLYRSPHLAIRIEDIQISTSRNSYLNMWVFRPPHVGTQLSRSGYSRCPCLGTQDLQIWVFIFPHLATQIGGTQISTSGYSRYPGLGTQDLQMWVFSISRCGCSDLQIVLDCLNIADGTDRLSPNLGVKSQKRAELKILPVF